MDLRNAYSVLLDEASDSASAPRRNSLRTTGINDALENSLVKDLPKGESEAQVLHESSKQPSSPSVILGVLDQHTDFVLERSELAD